MPSPYRPASAPHDTGTPIGVRFGRRLKTLRVQQGWTQVHMALHLGIDRSYLSEVERGAKSISLPMLEVLALGFRISVAQLLQDV